jgi:ubiquinone/menaquinone biosynthesis C-methylase UbiE
MPILDNTGLFSGKAESYSKSRPSYPKAAIDYICSLVDNDAVFADIGAGTGKFSFLIAERDYEIYAVEPNDDMRKELNHTLASFKNAYIKKGTDVNTELQANSVDIITVAQALHWFDLTKFRAECERILKPGGKIITIYNINPEGSSPLLSKKSTAEFYINPKIVEFENPIYYTKADWVEFRLSHSHDPKSGDENYESHIETVKVEFDKRAVDGKVKLELTTKIYSENNFTV